MFVKSRRKLEETTQMVHTCHAHVFQIFHVAQVFPCSHICNSENMYG